MSEELKPCPFCGGEKIEIIPMVGGYIRVVCWSCGMNTGDRKSEEVATSTWNRRTPNIIVQEPERVNDVKYIGPFAGMGDMALRDAFAMHFMERAQSLCECSEGWSETCVANLCYQMADAMMEVRKK